MIKNIIGEYKPINLTLSSLEQGEVHKYSFSANEYIKALFGYRAGAIYPFSLHLTNKRLILEPHQPKKWESLAMSAAGLVAGSLMDNPIGEYQLKSSIRTQKNIKGKYFSFPYTDIYRFETIKSMCFIKFARVVLKPHSGATKERDIILMPRACYENIDKRTPKSIVRIQVCSGISDRADGSINACRKNSNADFPCALQV